MSRMVRCGVIQARNVLGADHSLDEIREAMVRKHVEMIEQAAREKVQILCLQELFYGPYFCAEQDPRWYEFGGGGPGWTQRAADAGAGGETSHGDYRSGVRAGASRAVFQHRGGHRRGRTLSGKISQTSHSALSSGILGEILFHARRPGYPVFATKYAKVGVYICYDRHFPEGARALGLNGAEIVFNPSATVAGLSEYLWELEQPAHAVANGYYVGAINRVGEEKPWSIGEFYGKSYFCNPRGKIIAQASRDKDEVLVTDLDLDVILEVRKVWQFYRDRRPETYGILTTQSGKAGSGD